VYALCSVSELAFTSLCKPRMLKSKIPHARPHRNAKYYTLGTAQGTVLMRNSAVELYRLAPSSFYKLAYVYIWQVRSTRIHVFACVCVILVACDSLIFHPPPCPFPAGYSPAHSHQHQWEAEGLAPAVLQLAVPQLAQRVGAPAAAHGRGPGGPYARAAPAHLPLHAGALVCVCVCVCVCSAKRVASYLHISHPRHSSCQSACTEMLEIR
jgi:hypothetical protein